MKVKIWGSRGSIPAPLKPAAIREKIRQVILNMPEIDSKDPVAVDTYLAELSPLQSGTVGGNTTCVEVQSGSDMFIIDAGSGIRELGQALMPGPCGQGKGVLHLFFTHAHWDHVQGFPFFAPGFVPGNQITIHSVHDMHTALEGQQNPLNFPVPLSIFAADLNFVRHEPEEVIQIGDTEITMLKTVHPGDAYAYRFVDTHSTFVFASDAEYKTLDEVSLRPYLNFFKEADVLIFDAQYTLREGLQKIDWGHSSAMIGADLARMAGVKKLVLFHHDPTYSDEQLLDIQQRTIEYQAQDTQQTPCEVLVAYEGLALDLTPPGLVQLHYLPDDDGAVLQPTGHFDEISVARLKNQLRQFEAHGWPTRLIINLGQTETLSIAGLKALISLRQMQTNTAIALACLNETVRQVIDLAGLLDYFAIYPTVDAALTGLQASETLNLPGQLIQGRYQIEQHLGDSWQGAVFKAIDTHNQVSVAVTVLSASFGENIIDHLIRQATQFIGFYHPHIAQVLDCGYTNTFAYLVEAFTEVDTLHHLIKNAAEATCFTIEQVRDLSLKILSALEYTHSRGVIHYHLTPHNVLIGDGITITNFGLGLLTESRPLLESPLVFLKAAYLAPEQILGQAPDARTDLYALGVIMYEMLTGQPPFTGTDQAVMQAHLQATPRSLRDFNPKLSRSFEHLVLKLLAKDPEERYATAHQTNQILSNLTVHDNDDTGLSPLIEANTKPLINRTTELSQIQALWAAIKETGQSKLLAIQGEMGIGKSRLIAEFLLRDVEEQGFTAIVGRCNEFGLPYTPYAEMLASIFNRGLVDPQTIAEQAHYLTRQIPTLDPILSPYQTQSQTVVSTDAQKAQWHFFGTVLLILAKLGPTVLFLEDANYLDETSIALTRYLVRRGQLPLLIITASRNDETTSTWLEDFQINKKQKIILDPLPYEAVKAYLQTLMDGAIPPAIVNTVNKRSHGNPYFIEEITRHLIDKSTFKQSEDGTWVYHPDDVTGALPPTLLRVFSERVEKLAETRHVENLTESARQALSVAASIGPEFNFDLWVMVLGGASQEHLALNTLDEAIGLRLLRQTRQGYYAFDPVDIADALISMLNEVQQQDLHHRVAKILSLQQANPVIISHHYEEAGLPVQAAHYLELGAKKAMAAHAVNEAIVYYEQANKQVKTQDGYEALGNLYRQKGEATRSIAAFKQALILARQARDNEGQGRILNGLVLVLWLYDYYREAYQAAAEVLALPDISDVEYATAQSHLGMIAWVAGRLDEAESWCRKAVDTLTEKDDEERLGGIYNRLGLACLYRSKLREATIAFSRSLEIRRKTGDYWGQAYCLNNLGKIATEEGDFEQAEALLISAQQQFEEIDSPDGLIVVYTNQGRLMLRRQCPNQALAMLFKAIDISKRMNRPNAFYMGDTYLLLAEASLQRHDLKRARTAIQKALKIVEAAGNQEHIATAQVILAQIHATQNEVEQAKRCYQRAINRFTAIGSPAGLMRTQLLYAQFLVAHGETDEADLLEQAALAEAERFGLHAGPTMVERLR